MPEHVLHEPLTDIDRVLPILDQIRLFGGFSEGQLYSIFKLLKKVTYAKGDIVFQQGDLPSYIYIVLKGSIRLVFDLKIIPLSAAQLGPGACFGETALIGIQPHSATSLAEEETELLVLAKEDLMWLSEHEMELFGLLILNIAREACRRLHQTESHIQHYLQLQEGAKTVEQVAGKKNKPVEVAEVVADADS